MNYSDIQHRFANKLAGKNGSLKAGNVKYVGRNYYSYSTIFGQWVDYSKNVCVIFVGSTSISSSKHKLSESYFPSYVNVFPYDCGNYYDWRNCNLVGEYADDDKYFDFQHRCDLMDYYVSSMLSQFEAINGGKKKGLEKVDLSYWGYVEKLCKMYNDTTISKYIKHLSNGACKKSGNEGKMMIKLTKLLSAGERDVKTITDSLFGEGTFKKYWDYCARYRKAADKRWKVEMLCKRLGIASPYESSYFGGILDSGLTADQIRKLTANERNRIHFEAIMHKEYRDGEVERNKRKKRSMYNAYKWIVGRKPTMNYNFYQGSTEVRNVRNMFNNEVYEIGDYSDYYSCYGVERVSFSYRDFAVAEDKEQWIRDFYALTKEVYDNMKAIRILRWANADTVEKKHIWDDNQYILNDKVTGIGLDAESLELVTEYIRKQDAYFADKAARERAEEIARFKREEEERKEREYMAQVKQEQIDECLANGIDGCRDLWRKHLMDIHYAERETNYKGDFFMGGNVLLRLSFNKDKVETSKNIRIPLDVCKRFFAIIKKWHEDERTFKPIEIDTKGSGKYTISSYNNDILTAGCHKIAYAEMEGMYNVIQGL